MMRDLAPVKGLAIFAAACIPVWALGGCDQVPDEAAAPATSEWAVLIPPTVVEIPAATVPTTTTPPPAPSSVSSPRPTSENSASVEAVIRSVWPDSLADQAVRVAACESAGWRPGEALRFDEAAVGLVGERGLFQFAPVNRGWLEANGFAWGDMFDPTTNTRAALAFYETHHQWAKWTCRWVA